MRTFAVRCLAKTIDQILAQSRVLGIPGIVPESLCPETTIVMERDSTVDTPLGLGDGFPEGFLSL